VSAEEAASSIRHSLDEEQLVIVAAKVAGLPDAEIASRLGISRRTAAYRKANVFALLADRLDHLTDEARLECLDSLTPTLQAKLLQG
jgi:DNA-directed RNA polymerase specialized sigma24 family protein